LAAGVAVFFATGFFAAGAGAFFAAGFVAADFFAGLVAAGVFSLRRVAIIALLESRL
jgi:hypothetical protein